MKHIPEPDIAWLRDPVASVNRLTVHATWRSRRPLQMLSSTWQVTGATGTASELIRCAPTHQNFSATSVPGVLELDGSWMRGEGQAREEDASRVGDEEPSDLVHASILRREFIFDAPLKEAVERGWMMTLTFGGFSGPLYAWVDGTFVGFCADGFIPAVWDEIFYAEAFRSDDFILIDEIQAVSAAFLTHQLVDFKAAELIGILRAASF